MDIVVPAASIVEFKEAIIFGFLGVKYFEDMKNCSQGVGGMLVKGMINNSYDSFKWLMQLSFSDKFDASSSFSHFNVEMKPAFQIFDIHNLFLH